VLSFVSNDSGNPFVLAMCSVVVNAFCLFLGVKGNRCILSKRHRIAAVSCPLGWLEVK
jgi:hypothetical protein